MGSFLGAWRVREYVYDADGTYRGQVLQRRELYLHIDARVRVLQDCTLDRALLDHPIAAFAGHHEFDLVAAGVAALLAARIALQSAARGVDLVVATEGGHDQAVDAAFGDGAGVGALAHAAHRCSACRRAMRSAAGGCESWKREYSGSGVSVDALSR